MKNLIYIFFFLTQITNVFGQNPSQEATQLFELANEMYKQGNYENAIQKYEFIEKSLKQESADLYFNLGNAYYKLNKIGPTIYYYEKALLLAPDDEKITTNLEFAQKKTKDQFKTLKEIGFSNVIKKMASVFSLNVWTWLSVLFSFGVFAAVLGFLFKKESQQKRYFFIGIFSALFLMMFSFFMAFTLNKFIETDQPAIVFDAVIELKAEPKSDAEKVLLLHEGTKVNVLETMDNFKKVQLPNKTEGWVLSSAIKEVR